MATNMPVARSDDPCLEAVVAAAMASGGRAEARLILADLRRTPLSGLAPDPAETSVPVDDKPNPFTSPLMADHYLRDIPSADDVVHLSVPGPGSQEQHAGYAVVRAFRVVRQIGVDALPGLEVFGQGDGLGHRERGRRIKACARDKLPFAVVKPIDGMTKFLAVASQDRYASVAIVARGPQHVAFAVATGYTLAVGTHQAALVQRDSATWIPVSDLSDLPVLHGSIAAPMSMTTRGEPQSAPFFPEWGNPTLLNGVVFGGIEAAYQPDCRPCDAAASYIAAAAGRAVIRVTGGSGSANGRLKPAAVQDLLVTALLSGDKVPGLVVARGDLAAYRLLNHLRQCGIA